MKLTLQTIEHINLFENVTKAQVKDCIIQEEGLLFVIEEGSIKKALKMKNKVERMLRKRINIIGYSSDVKKFVGNLIYPEKAEIVVHEKQVLIKVEDSRAKGKIFGRGKERFQRIQEMLKKYSGIEEVKLE